MNWPRFRSIGARIVTLHIVAILAASICLPLLLLWMMNSAANDLQNRSLSQQAQEITAHLVLAGDREWRLDLPPAVKAQYATGSGYVFAVVDGNGRVLFASERGETALAGSDSRSVDPIYFQKNDGDRRLAGLSMPLRSGDSAVWIEVARDLAHRDVLIDDIVAGFLPNVGWIILPVLALLLAVDLAIFRRALKPLHEASQMAARIGPAAPDIRLPYHGMPRELTPLIAAVNHALDRLARGFRMQREFTADAAHELRTPLAILRAHVDLMRDQAVAATLRDDLQTMSRLVDQMLDIAEVDTLVIEPGERADLLAVSEEVASFLAPLALRDNREIAVSGSKGPVWIRGNAEVLFHAVRNLAENALRYTPDGTTVELDVSDAGVIRVIDCGPGVPENEQALVFQRFWRRHRRQDGSAGLGLSIVARIAEAHGGRVFVENRPEGGAVFVLDMTAARLQPVEAA